jgi:hypothetical protein
MDDLVSLLVTIDDMTVLEVASSAFQALDEIKKSYLIYP